MGAEQEQEFVSGEKVPSAVNAQTSKDYLKCAVIIGFPVVIQSMISSLINALDVFMLGQLGEAAITAASMSNQWFMLFVLLSNGIASAAAMFISQHWGKRDEKNIHHYMGILFYGAAGLSFLFMFFAMFVPEMVIGLYSMDPEVIREGVPYLRILGISYFLSAISLTCSTALRSIGKTNIPMIVSAVSLLCKAAGNFLLIDGNFGFPQLGLRGAAMVTVFVRTVETVVLVVYIIWKKPPVYGALRNYLKIPAHLISRYFQFGLLVILGEAVFAVGSNLYNVAYKYTGTQAQASLQIIQTVQSLALLFCAGFGSAAAVMLGTLLGSNEFDKARVCNRILTTFSMLVSVVMGAAVFLAGPFLIQVFSLSEETRGYVGIMVRIMACAIPLRTIVFMIICGTLRSGGDNLYCFLANLVGVWLIGLPVVFVAAVVLKWPVHLVFLVSILEDVGKLVICGPRVLRGKWLRNLTQV